MLNLSIQVMSPPKDVPALHWEILIQVTKLRPFSFSLLELFAKKKKREREETADSLCAIYPSSLGLATSCLICLLLCLWLWLYHSKKIFEKKIYIRQIKATIIPILNKTLEQWRERLTMCRCSVFISSSWKSIDNFDVIRMIKPSWIHSLLIYFINSILP